VSPPPTLKALCYVVQAGRLLVFRQPAFPAQGVQVLGGGVELHESLAEAALREAREESGISALRIERYLGSALYELRVDVGPPHLRHFFELSCGEVTPERWRHVGSRPAERSPVEFELWWEPLRDVRLDWEMDAYLARLS
jgi:8-oxo-dGTP pyrophosphatase MutT (NUDIX family)